MAYNGTITTADPYLLDQLDDVADGYTAYVRQDVYADSPRHWDCNGATFIMEASGYLPIDEDEAGLGEARSRWEWANDPYFFNYAWDRYDTPVNRALHKVGREGLIGRYINIFRPEVLHYEDHIDFGAYRHYAPGWGYVTRESLLEQGHTEEAISESLAFSVFQEELSTYRQWAEGEVYGVTVVRTRDGAEESLWGCYDNSLDREYLRSVAADLIAEMEV